MRGVKRIALLWIATGCVSSQVEGPPPAAPVYDFEDSLLDGITLDGCIYDEIPLTMEDEFHPLKRRVSDLVHDVSRSWTSTLAWCRGAAPKGITRVTWSFDDVRTATVVRPRRDPNAKGHLEMGCHLTLELDGNLHVKTDDGLWSAVMPATFEIERDGYSLRISGPPSRLAGLPWASEVGAIRDAWLASWPTPSGAPHSVGELGAHARDGSRILVAEFWEPGLDVTNACPESTVEEGEEAAPLPR